MDTEPSTGLLHCNSKGCFERPQSSVLSGQLLKIHPRPLNSSHLFSSQQSEQSSHAENRVMFLPSSSYPSIISNCSLDQDQTPSFTSQRYARSHVSITSISALFLLGLCAPAALGFLQDLIFTVTLW